jgi:hypothetical protein
VAAQEELQGAVIMGRMSLADEFRDKRWCPFVQDASIPLFAIFAQCRGMTSKPTFAEEFLGAFFRSFSL